jgi:hypothetical protein
VMCQTSRLAHRQQEAIIIELNDDENSSVADVCYYFSVALLETGQDP